MKDDEPTPEEQREAEALARALEGAPAESAAPPEALETAALLRHAHGEGRLDPARAQALGAKLRAEVRPPRRRWIWLLAPLAAGVTAAALLLFLRPAPRGLPALASLPAPAPALLAAQGEAARGKGQALASLDQQMRAYRRELFDRLRRGDR
jgi:hypothetical protein